MAAAKEMRFSSVEEWRAAGSPVGTETLDVIISKPRREEPEEEVTGGVNTGSPVVRSAMESPRTEEERRLGELIESGAPASEVYEQARGMTGAFAGAVERDLGSQLSAVGQLRGRKQFEAYQKLGIVPAGAQYVPQSLAGGTSWGYRTSEVAAAYQKQVAARELLRRYGDDPVAAVRAGHIEDIRALYKPEDMVSIQSAALERSSRQLAESRLGERLPGWTLGGSVSLQEAAQAGVTGAELRLAGYNVPQAKYASLKKPYGEAPVSAAMKPEVRPPSGVEMRADEGPVSFGERVGEWWRTSPIGRAFQPSREEVVSSYVPLSAEERSALRYGGTPMSSAEVAALERSLQASWTPEERQRLERGVGLDRPLRMTELGYEMWRPESPMVRLGTQFPVVVGPAFGTYYQRSHLTTGQQALGYGIAAVQAVSLAAPKIPGLNRLFGSAKVEVPKVIKYAKTAPLQAELAEVGGARASGAGVSMPRVGAVGGAARRVLPGEEFTSHMLVGSEESAFGPPYGFIRQQVFAGGSRMPSQYITLERVPIEPEWFPGGGGRVLTRAPAGPVLGSGAQTRFPTTATMTPEQVRRLTELEAMPVVVPSYVLSGGLPLSNAAWEAMPVAPGPLRVQPAQIPRVSPLSTPTLLPSPVVLPGGLFRSYSYPSTGSYPYPAPYPVPPSYPEPIPFPEPMSIWEAPPIEPPPEAPPKTPPEEEVPPRPPFWFGWPGSLRGGYLAGMGRSSKGPLGAWQVTGYPVYGPSPLTGEVVGARVGRRRVRYGAVPPKYVRARV